MVHIMRKKGIKKQIMIQFSLTLLCKLAGFMMIKCREQLQVRVSKEDPDRGQELSQVIAHLPSPLHYVMCRDKRRPWTVSNSQIASNFVVKFWKFPRNSQQIAWRLLNYLRRDLRHRQLPRGHFLAHKSFSTFNVVLMNTSVDFLNN